MDFSVRISLFPGLELTCIDYKAEAEHATAETLLHKHSDVIVPVIGLVQASHFLAYRLPKHLRQYGLSSREVKC